MNNIILEEIPQNLKEMMKESETFKGNQEESKYWEEQYPMMNNEQREKLYKILSVEQLKIAKLERKIEILEET